MSSRTQLTPLGTVVILLAGYFPPASGIAQPDRSTRAIGGTWTISFATGGNPSQTVEDREDQGDAPLRPAYREIWEDRQTAIAEAIARGRPLATTTIACLPQGMPSMMGSGGPFPMEILVSEGQVTIIQEAYNQVRRIYLDKPQLPLADIEPGYYGRSVARWEGNTLVVETLGIKESVEYRNVPHTANMRITERIQLLSDDVLENVVTIEDPAVLTEPWTFELEYQRLPDYEMMEYICEDNREYIDESGAIRLRVR
jgi:hypothetical protein